MRCRGFVCLAGVLLWSGCGGDPYQLATVRGKVITCEGKPAAGGVVVFYPIDAPEKTGRPAGNPGREARGTVAEDGTFSLISIGIEPQEGAVIGPHKVVFEMPPTQRPRLSAEDREGMSLEEQKKWDEEFARRPVYAPIPCSTAITPSEVTVVAGKNMLEFKLPPK
jgi:hypothetical protein